MNDTNSRETRTGLEIAVIGMSGKFPGAVDIHAFWGNIKKGVESVTFFTDDELTEAGVDTAVLANPNYVKAKGYIEDLFYFDSAFFRYTPKEAELMDPQLRLFHECTWHALEDASYDPLTYGGLIALYAGYTSNLSWKAGHLYRSGGSGSEVHEVMSLNSDFFPSQVCYRLNLRGPGITVNTACSTSLVAIHLACRSLLTGEADMALAGGVTVTLPWKGGYFYQEGMIMSPDGHCRPFDAKAAGTTSGNGAAVVVLKRLVKAVKDGDHIYAVIKGTAVNNDGNRKAGYSTLSVEAQAQVIRAARRTAEVEPGTIAYIETHGIGTPLGDAMEIEALKMALGTTAYKKRSCALGTLKANIGHLDAAAGAAAFVKAVLALYHRQIPPAVNFDSPHPDIGFENSPFYISKTREEWTPAEYPRRAGVSSFGIGGTNAHAVLEEWTRTLPNSAGASQNYRLIVLSARSETALDRMTENLCEFFKMNPRLSLADIAYTLQVGRSDFDHRRAFVCRDMDGAVEKLRSPGQLSLEDAPADRWNELEQIEKALSAVTGHGAEDAIRSLVPPPDPDRPLIEVLLERLGDLWAAGVPVDWNILYKNEKRNRVPLPGYPFDRLPHSIELPSKKLEAVLRMGKDIPGVPPVSGFSSNRPDLPTPYEAPRDNLEEILVKMWEDLLGIRPIGIHDDLVELGVDSIKGITFVNRFKEQWGVTVHIAVLFEAPVVAKIAAYLGETYPGLRDRLSGTLSTTGTAELKADHVVLLKKTSSAAGNIFFIHEISGEIAAYVEFCRLLDTGLNCWGLQAEKLKDYKPQNRSTGEIAGVYVERIRQIQPDGPYRLVTWSGGGHIVFEMALQLEQRGYSLDFAAFIDCRGPMARVSTGPSPEFTVETEKDYLKDFFAGSDMEKGLEILTDFDTIWTTVVNVLKNHYPAYRDAIDSVIRADRMLTLLNFEGQRVEDLIQYLNLSRTFGRGAEEYIPPRKLNAPFHFFEGTEAPQHIPVYWQDYCKNPVVHHRMEGDHYTIFEQPLVRNFAGVFSDFLKNLKDTKA